MSITKSDKSDEHAFNTVCSVDISVAHGGRQDIITPPYSSVIIYADLPDYTVVRCVCHLWKSVVDREKVEIFAQLREMRFSPHRPGKSWK